jgi:hypothetical protein
VPVQRLHVLVHGVLAQAEVGGELLLAPPAGEAAQRLAEARWQRD